MTKHLSFIPPSTEMGFLSCCHQEHIELERAKDYLAIAPSDSKVETSHSSVIPRQRTRQAGSMSQGSKDVQNDLPNPDLVGSHLDLGGEGKDRLARDAVDLRRPEG